MKVCDNEMKLKTNKAGNISSDFIAAMVICSLEKQSHSYLGLGEGLWRITPQKEGYWVLANTTQNSAQFPASRTHLKHRNCVTSHPFFLRAV